MLDQLLYEDSDIPYARQIEIQGRQSEILELMKWLIGQSVTNEDVYRYLESREEELEKLKK